LTIDYLGDEVLHIIESLDVIHQFDEETALTFGTFDGVHIGHQAVIKEVIKQAQRLSRASVILSFHPHPMAFLFPEQCPPSLTTMGKKIGLFSKMGVDTAIFAKLEKHISRMSAADFVKKILLDKLRAKSIVVGYDSEFGRDRIGNGKLLKKLGCKNNFDVKIVAPQRIGDITVSSTRIRQAISKSNLLLAKRLLGRWYSISGKVIKGKGIGRKIGYPTANIDIEDQMLPPFGIYAIRAKLDKKMFDGVLSMGIRPTIGDGIFQIEAHLFGLNDYIYGRRVEVIFIKKIRDEIAFSSLEQLCAHIERDIVKAKEILAFETDYEIKVR